MLTLTLAQIAAVLDRHSVPWYVSAGHIYADTMTAFSQTFEHVKDLTGYTLPQLRAWLGY